MRSGGKAGGETQAASRAHHDDSLIKKQTEEVKPTRTLQPIKIGIEHDYVIFGTR